MNISSKPLFYDSSCPQADWTYTGRAERGLFFGLRLQDIVIFMVPATAFIEIEIIGRLFMPDILFLTFFPFLIFARKGQRLEFAHGMSRTFLLLAGLWLLGQVITDLVRGTPFHDWSRGWAKIGFTMIHFATLCMLIEGRPRRIVLYAAGISLGGVLTYFFNPSPYSIGLPWKFGYGVSITWLFILLGTTFYRIHSSRQTMTFLVLVVIGLVNLFMGFRSMGGVVLLTLTFLVIASLRGRRIQQHQVKSKKSSFLFAFAILAGVLAIFALYGALAESGILGEEARLHFEKQSTGEYGLLIGGRSEILSSAVAVIDSPVLGHGSWAKDCRYTDIIIEMKRSLGYQSGAENEECLIPTHSIILGAWVEAGILGAIVWLWVGFTTLKALMSVFREYVKIAPLVVFFAFLLLWDLAFSPYGADRRFITTFFVVVIISIINWARKNEMASGHKNHAVANL